MGMVIVWAPKCFSNVLNAFKESSPEKRQTVRKPTPHTHIIKNKVQTKAAARAAKREAVKEKAVGESILIVCVEKGRLSADRRRQTDRQADRQTDRRTDRLQEGDAHHQQTHGPHASCVPGFRRSFCMFCKSVCLSPSLSLSTSRFMIHCSDSIVISY